MFCHKCGMSLPQDSQFCPFCGTDIEDIQPTSSGSEQKSRQMLQIATSGLLPFYFAKPEAAAETESVQKEVSPDTYKTETPPVTPQVQPYNEMARSQAPRYEDFPAPPAPKKKKKTMKILLIAAIALVVILAAVLIPLSLSNKKKQVRYDEGATLLEKGK